MKRGFTVAAAMLWATTSGTGLAQPPEQSAPCQATPTVRCMVDTATQIQAEAGSAGSSYPVQLFAAPALTAIGDTRGGLEMAHQIVNPTSRTQALAMVARVQALSGHREAAATTVAESRQVLAEPDPDLSSGEPLGVSAAHVRRAQALVALARAQLALGEPQAAASSLESALAEVRDRDGETAIDSALVQIAGAMAEAGNDAGARAVVRRVTSGSARGLGWAWVARAQAEAGRQADADQAISEAAALMPADSQALARASTLAALARAEAASHRSERARDDAARGLALVSTLPTQPNLLTVLTVTTQALAEAGDADQASQVIALTLERAGQLPNAQQRAISLAVLAWRIAEVDGRWRQ